ncbi:hypothetical protein C0993_006489 [Termitomyces sp. T159_Od127]|nr:hypothetical protein C0993_006489 [Termitomyces sp. T159_Od127]
MGVALSYIAEAAPPRATFSVDDIPDLAGRVVIVTGANTGTPTLALLAHNAKVYIAVRNKEKAQEAIKDLEEATGKQAFFLQVDLADLPTIKSGAEEFLRGVMMPPVELLTKQGYDLQFGTNVLAPTRALLSHQAPPARPPRQRKDQSVSIKVLHQYLIPWARMGKASPATQDPELGKQLWEWAEEQVANI